MIAHQRAMSDSMWTGTKNMIRKDLGYWIKLVDAEVIGNIFDNPELLEEENAHGM